jgi:hypothetical protein
MMKYGFLSFLFLSLFIWSCADDPKTTEGDSDTQEVSQESFPVEVESDEEGTPLPCSVIADELLASQLEGFANSDRIPEKLEDADSQSCSMSLLKENGQKIGEIRLIVKAMEARPDREAIAKRAKNTNYIDDLPMPAMVRQLSTLTTLVFDHGLYTYNLNINLRKGSNADQYQLARSIAIHIADNVDVEE